jgi:hypothetical protein
MVNDLKNLEREECLDSVVEIYVLAIKFNSFRNEQNASYLFKSQVCLFFAILSIGVIIGLVALPFIIKIFNL